MAFVTNNPEHGSTEAVAAADVQQCWPEMDEAEGPYESKSTLILLFSQL